MPFGFRDEAEDVKYPSTAATKCFKDLQTALVLLCRAETRKRAVISNLPKATSFDERRMKLETGLNCWHTSLSWCHCRRAFTIAPLPTLWSLRACLNGLYTSKDCSPQLGGQRNP